MGLFRRRMVAPAGPDRFVVRLGGTERTVLADVCGQLVEQLEGSHDNPALRRLFPPAHVADAALESEYRELVRGQLESKRLSDLRAVLDDIDATELTTEQLEAWMTAVNSVRLVLGTVLDVGEEPLGPVDPDDPQTPLLVVYDFLGALVDEIVTALSSAR